MNLFLFGILPALVAVAVIAPLWLNAHRIGWSIVSYLIVTIGLAALGLSLFLTNPFMSMVNVGGAIAISLAGIALFLGVIEFGLLRLLGLFRLGAISRVTYYEALLQPFTIIVLTIGLVAIGISACLGFFTYYEDFKMYRDVASSFVFLFTLPVMIFASTKVIDEEIENRTMLTLMSKPVARWQVVLGKYLGVLLLVLVAVMALGVFAGVCGYMRYFDDTRADYQVASSQAQVDVLNYNNVKAVMALLPSLVLTFLQMATLAAVSVAVSTRLGLAANVTIVIVIYLAANLARYAHSLVDLPMPLAFIVDMLTYLLPGLSLLDLNQRLVFGNYILGRDDWGRGLPTYGLIWQYVGIACLYAIFYISAVLSFGIALFRSRELS